MGISAAIAGAVAPYHPLLGIGISTFSGYLNRRIGQLPGLTVGDIELTIGTYSSKAKWGYQFTFRNGQILSSGGYYQQLPVGPLPPPCGP